MDEQALEEILQEVSPRFGLALPDARILVIDNEFRMSEGSIAYTHRPDIDDPAENRHLDSITFRIPEQFTHDPASARAYFAHECSHLELLKKPYHVTYFVTLTAAIHLERSMVNLVAEYERAESGRLSTLAGVAIRLAAFIPLALYGNAVEKFVDRNASSKGYGQEIAELRRKHPLKTFR